MSLHLPHDRVSLDLEEGSALLLLDSRIYSPAVIRQGGYALLDRAWVRVEPHEPDRLAVVVQPKGAPADEASLRAVVGELLNQLLCDAHRSRVLQHHRQELETLAAAALRGLMARGLPSREGEAGLDDPLAISSEP